jgi:hypothetical protein
MTIPTQAHDLTISTHPTATDAQLVVQLAQLSTSMHVDRGQALLHKHRRSGGLSFAQYESTYPAGSDDAIAILNVLNWYETIGTLVKQGLLDRGVILDWLWVSGAWEMCRPIALAQREETKTAEMWENFEALAATQA